MSFSPIQPLVEKPLSGASKLSLILGAVGIILLFYLFTAASVLALLILLGFESLVLVVLLRFGLAGFFANAMTEHLAPLPIFLRSLRIRKGLEFRIPLQRADAPELFAMLEKLCARAQVEVPRSVALEMNCGAWVRLKGYRRGAGKTTLGIGYDLLAGLTVGEIEGVLAHEMMHAKLVQRGLNQWLRGGLSRTIQLARGLSAQADFARRARKSASTTLAFLNWADWLARHGVRLVAGCSRQDEFAADLGATRICPPGSLQSALSKLETIERNAASLPWRERVAQLQLGESFGGWLTTELTASRPAEPEPKSQFLPSPNTYSTHPSLQDRLAALPAESSPGEDPRSGLALLAQPDSIAEKLMLEIQRVIALQEEKDSKQLNRWNRRIRSRSKLRPLQLLGFSLAALGLVLGVLFIFTDGVSAGLLCFMLVTVTPGILLFRFGGYRARIPLPVPDFAVLKAAWQSSKAYDQAKAEAEKKDLGQSLPSEGRQRSRARRLVAEAYQALGQCHYLRAHVAATLCLKENSKSVEATAALGIAAAALGQMQQVTWALQTLQYHTAFRGPSAGWAAAWMLMLCGGWDRAEALLIEARKKRMNDPTLLGIQAICQSRRGKMQSAIFNARKACELSPRSIEFAKLLISLLLDAGNLREAHLRLYPLTSELRKDQELIYSKLRLSLLSRKVAEAEEWAALYKESSRGSHTLVRLGTLYESSRQKEKAAQYFNQAVAAGHYPEALLGLARLEADQKNKSLAEDYLLAALELDKPAGEGGAGALHVLHQALAQLLMLQDPVPGCHGWIATFNSGIGPAALANQSFLIFAPSREDAESRLAKILKAMQPALPPLPISKLSWRQAPKERQPLGPVRIGIQGIFQ